MIGVVLRTSLLRLWHNRLDLTLAFVVPIIFFSIFALIFGGHVGRNLMTVKLAVVDQDRTDFSRQIVADLEATPGLTVLQQAGRGPRSGPLQPDAARLLVQQGQAAVAVVLPAGLFESVTGATETAAVVELLADSSEPVAPQWITGRLREAVMVHQGEYLASQGARRARAAKLALRLARGRREPADDSDDPDDIEEFSAALSSGWTLETIDVLGSRQTNPTVSMYAAGIAVLFLLFSTTNAAGSLLDEEEAGTLERLLTSQLTLNQLLAGKWLWTWGLACAQTTAMFVYAWLVFGVNFPAHIPGFCVMTACTTAAASSLALCLATLCRTRQQLTGVSTIVILSMSALGGSMVPRFVMSESLQRVGLFTFNAWALDGYNKVFWRQLPVSALGPQVGVLLGIAVGFFAIARWLSRRWSEH
ncbi:MAG: ABC transporter permease [Planctomycetes bacterium]|nr:ABC transporter permease [Planctomycetota bacterium]